jgi:aryl-alcohol dehydrogenase-like predicted oxidoreductase
MDYVTLGQTGIETSELAFGTGTNGWSGRSEQTELGLRGLADLLRFAYDHGITFFDSADQYGSHPHIREALRGGIDRDTVTILTKTTSSEEEAAWQDVHRYLRELGTDRIDMVLLHCMSAASWNRTHAGAMAALSRAQAEGLVRAVGVSCHDYGALQTAAREPWVEFVLARINYAGNLMDGPVDKIIQVLTDLHDQGKAVCGMKTLARGGLKQNAGYALRYVLELPCVDAITVGLRSRDEVLRNADAAASLRRRLAA